MSEYIGKTCPFCRTEIREEDAVKVCPACGIAHHQNCWNENKGCTTFGCSEQHYEAQNTNPTEVCGNCGAPLGDGQAFCPKCGTPKSVPKKNICGKCGNELADGQEFCPKCGQKAGLAVEANVNNAINQFNAGVTQAAEQKKKKPIIIAAIAAVAVLVLVLLFKGPSVDEIILEDSSVELREDETYIASYTINPEKAADASVKWESSNERVAKVSDSGKITAVGEGSCTVTATAGGKSDSITVTVKSGPDFKDLYNRYCNSVWASCGSDGSYLSLDTNPYDWDDDGVAYYEAYVAVQNINAELNLPDSLIEDMGSTSSLDGKQERTFSDVGVTVSWKYHPDKGLEVTYKLAD